MVESALGRALNVGRLLERQSVYGGALAMLCKPFVALAPMLVLLALLVAATAHAKPATMSGSFKLLTYNVAGLPEGLSSSRPSVNMPLISRLLNRYDLALVQEDFAYGTELRSAVGHPYTTPAFVRGTRVDLGDGLSQFSRMPFVSYLREAWRDCNGVIDSFFDCLTPKGLTFARHVLTTGITIDVYNVHLDAGESEGDERARVSQLTQLWNAIERHSKGRAVLVAGDTNLGTSERDVLGAFLQRTGLTDACRRLRCRDPWRIDRVLYRSSAAVRLDARRWSLDSAFVDSSGSPLSDHHPVAVEMTWRSTASAAEASASQQAPELATSGE